MSGHYRKIQINSVSRTYVLSIDDGMPIIVTIKKLESHLARKSFLCSVVANPAITFL